MFLVDTPIVKLSARESVFSIGEGERGQARRG